MRYPYPREKEIRPEVREARRFIEKIWPGEREAVRSMKKAEQVWEEAKKGGRETTKVLEETKKICEKAEKVMYKARFILDKAWKKAREARKVSPETEQVMGEIRKTLEKSEERASQDAWKDWVKAWDAWKEADEVCEKAKLDWKGAQQDITAAYDVRKAAMVSWIRAWGARQETQQDIIADEEGFSKETWEVWEDTRRPLQDDVHRVPTLEGKCIETICGSLHRSCTEDQVRDLHIPWTHQEKIITFCDYLYVISD